MNAANRILATGLIRACRSRGVAHVDIDLPLAIGRSRGGMSSLSILH